MISLDTETTGLDLHHGAKPFLVTTCDEEDNQEWWEWEVQPHNREPIVVYEDLIEIQQVIDNADAIVLQNAKFDYAALQEVFLGRLKWDWSKVHDTLLAGHLLASNQPHDLTTMAVIYLGVNLQPYEDALEKACNEARKTANNDYPDWRIAKKGLSEMPSAKGKVWKFDTWLPRRICLEGLRKALKGKPNEYNRRHPWWTVCSLYANSDSAATLPLFKVQQRLLKERGLWKIYLERLKVLPVACAIEERGITLNRGRMEKLCKEYQVESGKAGRICTNIAKSYNYNLSLPKSGNNKSLLEFVFGRDVVDKETGEVTGHFDWLKLPVIKSSKKTGKPSLNKKALEDYETSLPPHSRQLAFVKSLKGKRKRDTALTYMESYKRFWLPVSGIVPSASSGRTVAVGRTGSQLGPANWYVLHPSLNPTGTDTLRWSSSNPNEQNISKQEGFNLRYCFGPAPGREWWSLDAKNIELRIPAYEAGETEMVDLFEREDEGPYYGSYHMLVLNILHPDKFAKQGMECKKLYESTWYQWVKNGNFAVQYGSVEQSGTADRAYHVPGAFKQIKRRFKKIHGPGGLNDQMIAHAQKHGYVETMPDKTVDPKRGYPLLCSRSKWGRVLPTVPLNYHVSGTACWWMAKAMVRCQTYLDKLNARPASKGYYMVMQVHDEIVFDFPQGRTKSHRDNLPKIRKITGLMEQGGDDIGVPIPVGIDYHSTTWSEGVSV